MGAIYAVATLIFKADQGISGIGIFLFGLGFSELLFLEQVGTPRSIPSFRKQRFHFLGIFHTLEIFCLTILSLFI